MLVTSPLSSKHSMGLKISVAVWVTTLRLLVPLLVRTVTQWQHSIQNLKKPLPLTMLLQVCWQLSNLLVLWMQLRISLQQQPTIKQTMYEPTIMPIIPPADRKEFKPAAPIATHTNKIRFTTTTGMCMEELCFRGTFFWVKPGSRRLKNMAPNPLEIPWLHAAKASGLFWGSMGAWAMGGQT